MRHARTCYDHFAGRLGVGLAQSMSAHGHAVLSAEGGEMTRAGLKFLDRFGIDTARLQQERRAVIVTPHGRADFNKSFGLRLAPEPLSPPARAGSRR